MLLTILKLFRSSRLDIFLPSLLMMLFSSEPHEPFVPPRPAPSFPTPPEPFVNAHHPLLAAAAATKAQENTTTPVDHNTMKDYCRV